MFIGCLFCCRYFSRGCVSLFRKFTIRKDNDRTGYVRQKQHKFIVVKIRGGTSNGTKEDKTPYYDVVFSSFLDERFIYIWT